ncbi:hypothetical protein [Tenacibaculum sp. 190524A02b]|uniref:hypothetical protein n=1 Tax=Tenacibaculum vairaonense TaxID=3137860 RepID=UPI0031FB627B
MKKQILDLGKALEKQEQKQIKGGVSNCYEPICEKVCKLRKNPTYVAICMCDDRGRCGEF